MIEEFASALARKRRGLFLCSAGKTLVGLGYAEEAVDWCQAHGAVVLGFEGFTTDGASLVPEMEYIADFSTITGNADERVVKSADAARMVLLRWKNGPEFVEFVLDDPMSSGPARVDLPRA